MKDLISPNIEYCISLNIEYFNISLVVKYHRDNKENFYVLTITFYINILTFRVCNKNFIEAMSKTLGFIFA